MTSHREGQVPTARERFEEEARGLGLDIDELSIRTFPQGTRTAADAAAAIGCDVAAIVKSLVFMSDTGEPYLVLTSGANRVDTPHVAAQLGVEGLRQATADEAREHTGYAIGGTPPLARVGTLRRALDRDLLELDVVWGAAGTPTDVFPIAPDALSGLTGAVAVTVRPPGPGAG